MSYFIDSGTPHPVSRVERTVPSPSVSVYHDSPLHDTTAPPSVDANPRATAPSVDANTRTSSQTSNGNDNLLSFLLLYSMKYLNDELIFELLLL